MTPDEKRKQRIESTPPMSRGIMERALSGKATRAGCIKAMCLECVGFERAAITECTAYACPLWHKRPFQPKGAK